MLRYFFQILPPKNIIKSEHDFNALDQALGMYLNMPIYSLLAAILHLGNVSFENGDTDSAQIAEDSSESFECAANLLKISNEELKDALLNRKSTVHCQNDSESCTMPNDILMAARTKNSIMKHIYNALFEFLIENLNEFYFAEPQKYIGILDIAGFGKNLIQCSRINDILIFYFVHQFLKNNSRVFPNGEELIRTNFHQLRQ